MIKMMGERIILRPLRNTDALSISKHANDLDVARYTLLPHPYRLKDATGFIGITKKNRQKKKAVELGIESKETKEIIGMISLMNIDWKNKNAELGYWLGKRYWNKGIMKEAVRLLLQFGFKKLKLEKIYAKVLHPNIASAKVLEKSGFVSEGRLRKATLRRGKWYDDLYYGILKTEFVN